MSEIYDAVILGGGPAGLSAAIYLARAQYKVLVLEKEKIGGQITITSEVVNYPGVLSTSGEELTETMRKQAQNFGAEFLLAEVTDLDLAPDVKVLKTNKGEIKALGVVLATGANPRQIGFEGESEFRGRGVAYCATCDGEFFTGMDVFVVGGGFAAAEEAMFLTKYAKHVTIIVREPDFTCAKSIADEVKNHPDISVRYNTEVEEVGGDTGLRFAVFKDNEKGETYRYENETGFGVFVFAGYVPATGLFKGKVELDDQGYLITDGDQRTNVEGVYGAGDLCVKNLRQVVTAVSDGAIAATSLEKHISAMYEKLGLEAREKVAPAPKPETKTPTTESGGFITAEMKGQLSPIFDRMQSNLLLKLYSDGSDLAEEMKSFLDEVVVMTDKVRYEVEQGEPSIAICNADGEYQRVQFHGVPGGHEINSFIVALYNAAGPGQQVDPDDLKRIQGIGDKHNMKIMVSLSCTMCPELVMATQRIALENPNIEAEMFDLANYPDIKDKYKIMSVPCLVIDDEEIHFGKKDIPALLDILKA